MTPQTKLKIASALTLSLLISLPPGVFAAAKKRAASHASGGGGGGGGTMMQTPNPQNPLEHNNRGVEYGSKGMWAQALQEHEAALAGDPWNLTFRQNLSACALKFGESLLAKKNYKEAMSRLRFAIYVDPENRAADEYLNTAIKASGKNPDDAKVRKDMAEALDGDGNYVEAIAEYKHYVRMNDNGEAHYGLGSVLVKQGSTVPIKLVEGYKELKTALTKQWEKSSSEQADLSRCHARLGDILTDMANIAHEHGNNEVALKRLMNAGVCYRRAVQVNPLNSDAIRGLIEVSRLAVAANPSFDNHLTLAAAYQLQPDFEHAKHEYEECYKLNRNSPALAQARRSYHLAVVSTSTAGPMLLAASMQKIEDQLRNNPNDAELLYIYGRGKEQLGDRDGAIRAYEAAARLNNLIHPQLMPRLAALQGGGMIGNGTAGPLTPAKAGAIGSLANPGALGAPPAQALAATPGALAPPGGTAAPGAPTAPGAAPKAAAAPAADYSKGEGLLKGGNADGAITAFTEIIDKNPGDAHAWFLLGSANEKKGDLEGASAAFRQASNMGEKEAQSAQDRVNGQRTQPLLAEVEKCMAAKNLTGAKSALQDAVDMDPRNSGLHQKLLGILKELGDPKEVEREQKRIDELAKGAK